MTTINAALDSFILLPLAAVPRWRFRVDREFLRRMLAFSGPGYLVAVGYMDPGNWATDIAGGSAFGYGLLSVIFLSNLMAVLLQYLSAKLGIATDRTLAQLCRQCYSRRTGLMLWLLCEVAIIACDFAEVIGTAIGLNLLFGLPLIWGACLSASDALLLLAVPQRRFRIVEGVVVALLAVIGACFAVELVFAGPVADEIVAGLLPQPALLTEPARLYAAIGIIGATVMPHNLYLHSALVQQKPYEKSPSGRGEAIRFAGLDSLTALSFALLVNAAILILAAAAFHARGETGIAEIADAHRLLAPMLGAPLAGTLFAVALLAAGQNSTVTGTLAGQVVMEGFLDIRLPPWLRRLATRLLAVLPVIAALLVFGEGASGRLLIASQVIICLQLPFAIIPLVQFTGDRIRMGRFVNTAWLGTAACAVAAVIVVLDLVMLAQQAGLALA
jgi:manganese transport protein